MQNHLKNRLRPAEIAQKVFNDVIRSSSLYDGIIGDTIRFYVNLDGHKLTEQEYNDIRGEVTKLLLRGK